MPVYMNLKPKPLSSSNKQMGMGEGQSGCKYDVTYTYNLNDTDKVYVTHPFIDKISITVPVYEKIRQRMIRDMMMYGSKDEEVTNIQNCSNKGSYGYAIKVSVSNSSCTVKMYAGPKKAGVNFVRLEFNPSAIGDAGLGEFKAILDEYTIGALTWEHILATGKATRIDFAVDLLNATMGRLLYQSADEAKHVAYVGTSGDLETVYPTLKKNLKNSDALIYDKRREAQDKGLTDEYGYERCRVEMIYRYSKQMLSKIDSISNNVFERVMLFYPNSRPKSYSQTSWNMFLDSCQLRGVENALLQLPSDMRTAAAIHFAYCEEEIWKPEKLWALWPNAVKKSGLLSVD